MSADGADARANWRAFVVCLTVAALAVLDISKVNVAIPAIEGALGASPTSVQLIVAGYVLAFGLALVPSGRYGDLHSRRRMFLAGQIVFGIASIACAAAPAAEVLVAARLLQGLAAGMLMPQVLGLIQQLFTGAARGKAFGLFGMAIGLTIAIAPPLGGALVGLGGPVWGWRLVFLVNVPILLVLFPLAVRYLPRHVTAHTGPKDLDPLGILLLTMTTTGLMLPFVLTTGAAEDDPRRWLVLIGAGLAGAAFLVWERRYARIGRTPVVDLTLFSIGSYRHGVLLALLYYGGSPAAMLVTTLFLQQGLGLNAPLAGLAIVPFALAYIASSSWSGRSTQRLGRPLVIWGLIVALIGWACGIGAAVLLPAHVAAFTVPLVLALAGAGAGAVSAPNQTLTLHDVPPKKGGLAGSIGQVAQRVGAAMGVAISTSIYYQTLARETPASGALAAYHDAYRNAVFACMVLIGIAVILALFDERWRRRMSAR